MVRFVNKLDRYYNWIGDELCPSSNGQKLTESDNFSAPSKTKLSINKTVGWLRIKKITVNI